jgi:hypothetical protein
MQVFLARAHTVYEGSSVFGIFSSMDAAIACLKAQEATYSGLEDGELKGKIVYNRTDGHDSLQVLVYTVEG